MYGENGCPIVWASWLSTIALPIRLGPIRSAVKALRAGPITTKVIPSPSMSMNINGRVIAPASSSTPVSTSITAPPP